MKDNPLNVDPSLFTHEPFEDDLEILFDAKKISPKMWPIIDMVFLASRCDKECFAARKKFPRANLLTREKNCVRNCYSREMKLFMTVDRVIDEFDEYKKE